MSIQDQTRLLQISSQTGEIRLQAHLSGFVSETRLKVSYPLEKRGRTKADLYRKGLCAMLVEGQELVPDDDWSMTDEDPIESEAEYSGSETSESGSESELE
jgi:hypothetical protein